MIKKWIAPQTTVISDCWRSYQTLSAEGFQHLQINHSLHFVDPSNPTINTNRIESVWRHAKESFSTHGRVKVHVPGNLARYMFTKAVRAKNCNPTEEFLKMAAFLYSNNVQTTDEEEEQDTEDGDLFEEI